MRTIEHLSPLAGLKHRHAAGRRPSARTAGTADPAPASSPCTRSALPLALSWFVIPALLLILSRALGWPH
jgi:hypothetical protein